QDRQEEGGQPSPRVEPHESQHPNARIHEGAPEGCWHPEKDAIPAGLHEAPPTSRLAEEGTLGAELCHREIAGDEKPCRCHRCHDPVAPHTILARSLSCRRTA